MTSDTDKLLAERTATHGEYTEHARITQAIMDIIQGSRNWPRLMAIQRESLHMFAHKIGRICVGDPNHKDHWDDISGYSILVSQRLNQRRPAPGEFLKVGTVPVHAVGDSEPTLTGNPEAHDYEGSVRKAPRVPIEDSNRHADRWSPTLRDQVNTSEYNLLRAHQRAHYKWDSERQEWRLG
jgi:hypothetical protein